MLSLGGGGTPFPPPKGGYLCGEEGVPARVGKPVKSLRGAPLLAGRRGNLKLSLLHVIIME